MSDSKKNHQGLDPDVTEKLQRQAAELAESVNAGDYGRAMSLINDLSEVKDQSLYREVGRLTRSLHEAIRNFQIDPRNAEQKEALSKMTDASDRLEYVVQMTAQAANRTMDLVEESMPMAHAMRDEAAALRQEWQRLRRREMQPDEFRDLYARIDTFFSKLTGDADTLYGNLSEILLAQDFQDLTGQVIQKVTTLVKEVEEHLLSLVVMASHVDQLTGTVHQLDDKSVSAEEGVGPQIRTEERDDVVSGQDDVDDLLSSLGF
ncbi:protein phosphatase CheZ [Marinobacter lutaoensis]|jgi:chemotaxis protein CheZ|uniref:Protein phosphatase CheZ n=1 Tax=Marinobacter lutaoensis TaxID=135739 RepID=A0A1V2DYI1_9GAMM|nr:protein phosphatase CheZ [Marinobacter lutaoensis]MBE03307.1 protein phosphatase [Marinobacter sp.]MBI44511.1 protein phosphatase [Oceanospirillales bacterium]NVD34447.1 protein phosphatase CheZ [Marinobacter lutaoensis]ONF45480.1 protein phosphatase [Marinobacter lutaoensis]|tara:strand:+ start:2903 stop:3688 length:786 start_codon:yes stop_codon:yes gene_type:complete